MPRAGPKLATKFDRNLLAFSSRFYWLASAICFACTLGLGYGAYRQAIEPAPEVATVEGVLEHTTSARFGVELELSASRTRFLVAHVSLTLRERLETKLRTGAFLVLEVDAQDLASAAADAAQTVRVYGVVAAGERLLSPEEMHHERAESVRTLPYLLAPGVLLAGFLAVCAVRRGRLAGVVAESPTTPIQDVLTLRAPFELHGRFGRRERSQIVLIVLMLGTLGLVMCIVGVRVFEGVAEIEQVWQHGTAARAVVLHAVEIKPRERRYKLQLQFEHGGQTVTTSDEFPLWGEKWSPPSSVEVRFMPGTPSQVVSAPAYRARKRGRWLAYAWGALGASMILIALYAVARIRRKLSNVRELARFGVLARAEVVTLRQVIVAKLPYLELSYKLPLGEKTTEAAPIDDPPPMLRDGDVIVLASHDHRISCALRVDGYPLELHLDTSAQRSAVPKN